MFLSVVWRNFCVRGWKKSHRQSITREWLQKVSIFVAVDCGKSNVKRGRVCWLLVEIERVRVFSLEVTLERMCWPCKWKCERELCWLSKWNCEKELYWLSKWNSEKESECWKIRVFIENSCHGVGAKNAGENWNCGRSFEH